MPELLGKFAGDSTELLPVVKELHRLHLIGVNAGPDDMTVLAAFFDVKHERPRLAGQAELPSIRSMAVKYCARLIGADRLIDRL